MYNTHPSENTAAVCYYGWVPLPVIWMQLAGSEPSSGSIPLHTHRRPAHKPTPCKASSPTNVLTETQAHAHIAAEDTKSLLTCN